eukprot:TRINITY_DN19856_c2_g1_i2.p1 TRINITY_DN19856_c2_g1~~TRINITY_DN19856_c2_g1_i2.p1  ORF type:complete len:1371 (-),score=388.50 TRINITY_DN19856_c2_g1_i2:42-4154(-)
MTDFGGDDAGPKRGGAPVIGSKRRNKVIPQVPDGGGLPKVPESPYAKLASKFSPRTTGEVMSLEDQHSVLDTEEDETYSNYENHQPHYVEKRGSLTHLDVSNLSPMSVASGLLSTSNVHLDDDGEEWTVDGGADSKHPKTSDEKIVYSTVFTYASEKKSGSGSTATTPKSMGLGDSFRLPKSRQGSANLSSTTGLTTQEMNGDDAPRRDSGQLRTRMPSGNNVITPKANAGFDENGEPIRRKSIDVVKRNSITGTSVVKPSAGSGFDENGEPVQARRQPPNHKTDESNASKPQRKIGNSVITPKASSGFDENGEPLSMRPVVHQEHHKIKKPTSSVVTPKAVSGFDENGEPIQKKPANVTRRPSNGSALSSEEVTDLNSGMIQGENRQVPTQNSRQKADESRRKSAGAVLHSKQDVAVTPPVERSTKAPSSSNGVSVSVGEVREDNSGKRRNSVNRNKSQKTPSSSEHPAHVPVVQSPPETHETSSKSKPPSLLRAKSGNPVKDQSTRGHSDMGSIEESLHKPNNPPPSLESASESHSMGDIDKKERRTSLLRSKSAIREEGSQHVRASLNPKTGQLPIPPQDVSTRSSIGDFSTHSTKDQLSVTMSGPTKVASMRANEKRKNSPNRRSNGQIDPVLATISVKKDLPEPTKPSRPAIPFPVDEKEPSLKVPTKNLPHKNSSPDGLATAPVSPISSPVLVPSPAKKLPAAPPIVEISSTPRIMTEQESLKRERRKTETEKAKKNISEMMPAAPVVSGSPRSEQEKQDISSNVRLSLFMNKIDYSKKETLRSPSVAERTIHEYDEPSTADETSELIAPTETLDSQKAHLSKSWIAPKSDDVVIDPEQDKVAKMIMEIRKRQIMEQPVPKKLDNSVMQKLQQKFDDANAPKPSTTKEHLGRPIQKINNQLKLVLEEKFLKVVEKREKRPSTENLGATGKIAVKKKYQSEKAANGILERVEDKVNKSRQRKTDGMEPRVSSEEKTASMGLSNVVSGGDTEIKVYPEIEVVIDSILENSPLITEFSFDGHPFFLSVPGKDNLHKTLSKLFAEALAFNTHLKSISLQSCGLGDVFLNELVSHIQNGSLRNLENLNLKGNNITSNAIISFVNCLGIGYASDEEDFKSEPGIPMNLKKVNIHGQLLPLSNEAEEVIAQVLQRNTSIIEFTAKLSNNDVRQLIKKFTARNKGLLSGDHSSEEKNLTVIEQRIRSIVLNAEDDDEYFEVEDDFTFKVLGSKAQVLVAKAMRTNTRLKTLRLVKLNLGDEFAFYLAQSLLDNVVLESLDLKQNKITAKGVLALAECLRINPSLKNVYLDDQIPPLELDRDTEMQIVDRLQSNTSLLKFGIKLRDPVASAALDKIINRNCLLQLQSWGKKSQ